MLADIALRNTIAVIEWFRAIRARAAGERGQTLAEYSLIITVIAVALITLAVIVFREQLAGAFNAAANCLDGAC